MYNVPQANVAIPRSVHELLHNVNVSDERLEANLCTMLQSVRGTSQYWYKRKGELRCMLRELGPPLFLTLSCAEYASADIEEYCCTEDPISVSIKFSAMFHTFFKIIIKGGALGKVDHYYIKTEYQARGAPHYHFLLWIHGAPVAGVDPPEKVLAWIEKRITYSQQQDKEPELYDLVTRYQMHKCSAYCKKPKQSGTLFVKKCKFGFPRPVTQAVSTVWKTASKQRGNYHLKRTEDDVKINYNPLLLKVWKANMDIQYIAESTMALAHYVSGYVTKAERSHV